METDNLWYKNRPRNEFNIYYSTTPSPNSSSSSTTTNCSTNSTSTNFYNPKRTELEKENLRKMQNEKSRHSSPSSRATNEIETGQSNKDSSAQQQSNSPSLSANLSKAFSSNNSGTHSAHNVDENSIQSLELMNNNIAHANSHLVSNMLKPVGLHNLLSAQNPTLSSNIYSLSEMNEIRNLQNLHHQQQQQYQTQNSAHQLQMLPQQHIHLNQIYSNSNFHFQHNAAQHQQLIGYNRDDSDNQSETEEDNMNSLRVPNSKFISLIIRIFLNF
jgi:hypothetical protein